MGLDFWRCNVTSSPNLVLPKPSRKPSSKPAQPSQHRPLCKGPLARDRRFAVDFFAMNPRTLIIILAVFLLLQANARQCQHRLQTMQVRTALLLQRQAVLICFAAVLGRLWIRRDSTLASPVWAPSSCCLKTFSARRISRQGCRMHSDLRGKWNCCSQLVTGCRRSIHHGTGSHRVVAKPIELRVVLIERGGSIQSAGAK